MSPVRFESIGSVENVLRPVHVFASERSVDDAAVMVLVSPSEMVVPFIVNDECVRPELSSVPEREGVNVSVEPEPTMVLPIVSPLKVPVVVAIPIAPASVCPVGPTESTPVFEMVTFPVAPETLMPLPAMLERTPVFVTLPPEYWRPEEKVVVAA